MSGVGGVSGPTRVTGTQAEERVESGPAPQGQSDVADGFERGAGVAVADARPGSGTDRVARRPELEREVQARLRSEISGAAPAGEVAAADGAAAAEPPLTPRELIESAPNTFDLAARQLDAGDGAAAADILADGARTLREGMEGAGRPERDVLETLANNMDKRASAYRQEHPDDIIGAAGSLSLYGRNATIIGEGIAEDHPEYGELLQQVGRDSQIQAQMLAQAGRNTKSMIGRGVSQTYRDIVNASFDHDIANTGSINNFFTGSRDELEADKAKMNQVFDYVDQKMEREGLTFDEAWHGMFDDHRIPDRGVLPDFATPHDAAAFLRDHDATKGLLAPMADLSAGIVDGDDGKVDRARGQIVESLRENGQWGIAKQVLDNYQQGARTDEGRADAQRLVDNESGEFWKAKATEFATEDLPVLLLTGVVSGGAGLGARALAGAAGWGTRAARATQIATEIGTFVPTERVLSDAINGRRADWSAEGMARDYALTAGGYGLFRALGAGWKALRAPRQVRPGAADASRVAGGRPTNVPANEAPENIRALRLENESAQTLARNGYDIIQNPRIPGGGGSGVKMPDYRIGGHLFDNYAPTSGSARNIWTNVQGKVQAEQARRIVLNLDDSAVSMDKIRQQFADWPIEGLEQLLIVRGGRVTNLALPRPSGPTPWITPGAYPHREQD